MPSSVTACTFQPQSPLACCTHACTIFVSIASSTVRMKLPGMLFWLQCGIAHLYFWFSYSFALMACTSLCKLAKSGYSLVSFILEKRSSLVWHVHMESSRLSMAFGVIDVARCAFSFQSLGSARNPFRLLHAYPSSFASQRTHRNLNRSMEQSDATGARIRCCTNVGSTLIEFAHHSLPTPLLVGRYAHR